MHTMLRHNNSWTMLCFFKDLAGICHDLFEWAISIFHFNQVVLSINGDISSFNFFGFLLLLKVTGQSNVLTFFSTARELEMLEIIEILQGENPFEITSSK